MDLTLHDGSIVSFTAAELDATLTRLASANQSYCLGPQDTALVLLGPNLLVMDVGWLVGRKLIEMYSIEYDTTFPFLVRFALGQSHYTLNQALAGAGYVGEPTTTSLAQVYMGAHLGAAQTYLEAGQLVKSRGLFQGAAAELKSLAAGNGITLTEGADSITIDGATTLTAQAPLDITDGLISVDLSGKQDALTVNPPLSLVDNVLDLDVSNLQPSLGTGNPSIAHVELIDAAQNSIKALVASGGIAAGELRRGQRRRAAVGHRQQRSGD